MKHSILIVEDEPNELRRYVGFCRDLDYEVFGADSAVCAREVLAKQRITAIVVDIFLSSELSMEGLDLLAFVSRKFPHVLPVVMSGNPSFEVFQRALKLGALSAIKKPILNGDEIALALHIANEKKILLGIKNSVNPNLSEELRAKCPFGLVLEEQTLKMAEFASRNPTIPVVIFGETGTGKEEVARLIQNLRCLIEPAMPFVPVNCALLNSDVAMSELFGHAKGSFSGADRTTDGFISAAHGGILFLDEIHTLNRECQQKILRVIHDGTYHRVGDTRTRHSAFQLIVAMSRQPDTAVAEGSMLMDLRGRITGVDIELKPLRDRVDEIPLLIELFLAKADARISSEQLSLLKAKCQSYYWQGNIRQLFQVLKAMVALSQADGEPVQVRYLRELSTMLAPSNPNDTTIRR